MNAARPTQGARTDVTAMSLGIFARPGTRHHLLAVIYRGNLCVFNVTGHAITRTIPPCTARQETAAIDGDRAITDALRQGSRLSWRLLSAARSIPGRAPRRPICFSLSVYIEIHCATRQPSTAPLGGGAGSRRWRASATMSRGARNFSNRR